MRNIKFGFWIILAGFVLSSCLSNIQLEEDLRKADNQSLIMNYFSSIGKSPTVLSDGSYYAITKNNVGGEVVSKGDSLIIRYEISNLVNGKILDSTGLLTDGEPLIYRYGFANPIFTSLIPLMKEGETAVMCMPGTSQNLPDLPAYTPTKITIKSLVIKSEIDKIKEYIAQKGYSVTKSFSNGYHYIQLKSGTGDSLINGKNLGIKYTGKFLSDYTFDGNMFKTDTLKHVVGNAGLVDGFAYAVEHMLLGERGIAIFPSTLGYGERGSSPNIPSFAPLVFEVELVNVK